MPDLSKPYLDWLEDTASPPEKISPVGWKRAADVLIQRMRTSRRDILSGSELPALSSYVRSYSQVSSLLAWVEFVGPRTAYINQPELTKDVARVYKRRDLVESSWSKTRGRCILDGLLRRRGVRKLSRPEREMVDELRKRWQDAGCPESVRSYYHQEQALAKHYKRHEKYQEECLNNGIFLTRRQAYAIPENLRRQARVQARTQGSKNSWFVTADSSLSDEVMAHLPDRTLREALWRQKQAFRETDGSISNVLRMRHNEAVREGYKNYAAYQFSDHAVGQVRAIQSLLSSFLEQSAPAQSRFERQLLSIARQEGLEDVQPWDRAWLIERGRTRTVNEPDHSFSMDCLIDVVIPELLALGQWRVEGVSLVGQSHRKRWCYDIIHIPSEDHIAALLEADPHFVAPPPRRAQVWFAPYNPDPSSESNYGGYELCVRDRWNSLGSDDPSHHHTDYVLSTYEQDKSALTTQLVYVSLMIQPDAEWVSWQEVSWVVHEMGHVLHDLAILPLQHNYSYCGPSDMIEFPSQLLEAMTQDPRLLSRWAKASAGSDKQARRISFWTNWLQSQVGWLGSTRNQAIDGLVDLNLHKISLSHGQVAEVQAIYKATCERYKIQCHEDDRTIYQGFMWDGYMSCYYSYTFGQMLTRALIPRKKDMTINSDRVKKVFTQLLEEVLPIGIDGPRFSRAWKNWKGESLKDSLARGAHLYAKDMSLYAKI